MKRDEALADFQTISVLAKQAEREAAEGAKPHHLVDLAVLIRARADDIIRNLS